MAVASTQVTIRSLRRDDITLTRPGNGEVHLHIGQIRIKCAAPGNRFADVPALRDEAAAMRRLAGAAIEAALALDARVTELEAAMGGGDAA